MAAGSEVKLSNDLVSLCRDNIATQNGVRMVQSLAAGQMRK
jgi:hypothetical protein